MKPVANVIKRSPDLRDSNTVLFADGSQDRCFYEIGKESCRFLLSAMSMLSGIATDASKPLIVIYTSFIRWQNAHSHEAKFMKRAQQNLNDLLAFLLVAGEGSFTWAAAQLSMSQSALSHTMRGLELRMGTRLLTRATRSVSATENGERLVQNVRPLGELRTRSRVL